MEIKTQTTEQILLEAAEKLFIEKGFDGAKTTEIARLAGVNHALSGALKSFLDDRKQNNVNTIINSLKT